MTIFWYLPHSYGGRKYTLKRSSKVDYFLNEQDKFWLLQVCHLRTMGQETMQIILFLNMGTIFVLRKREYNRRRKTERITTDLLKAVHVEKNDIV